MYDGSVGSCNEPPARRHCVKRPIDHDKCIRDDVDVFEAQVRSAHGIIYTTVYIGIDCTVDKANIIPDDLLETFLYLHLRHLCLRYVYSR